MFSNGDVVSDSITIDDKFTTLGAFFLFIYYIFNNRPCFLQIIAIVYKQSIIVCTFGPS